MRPRLKREGGMWVCRSRFASAWQLFATGCGKTPIQAYVDWQLGALGLRPLSVRDLTE